MDNLKRILVVDDDLEHLWLSKLILERRGYTVIILSACTQLLQVIKDFRPGLIFMDHWMPQMTGMEATRLIKSDDYGRQIPVVYFTGGNNIAELAIEAGADDWLSKPFRLDEFRAKADKYF
ncbi:MAG TPA: response regulator [Verrucomicrobiae bacterium]|nr:response regulator [Verrucomicrobiae bacterium]